MPSSLKPSTDLAGRIASLYPSLSTGHRKVAEFVLQNPLDTATMTIEGLATKSGSSTATVTRFVRTLGFSGYAEFRSSLTEALKLAMEPVRGLADNKGQPGSPHATLIEALRQQAANLDAAIAQLDEASVTRALELILGARRIFIVGNGASQHVAAFMEDGLALYLDADVIFLTSRGGTSRTIRQMMSAGPQDLLIAISMPRYSRATLDICGFAAQRGTPTLALTDGLVSPLAQVAAVSLFAPAGSRLLPNSPSAIFALADALITVVARERPNSAEALRALSESMLWDFHR